MSQASILVVDDEQDIRNLVSEILEDEGYSVTSAENGETARAAFAGGDPDLVLLDIWMPDIDGITLLKEWTASGRLNCPVVMISGHGTLETAVEATRLGAFDFVQKPLSLAKLLATVRNALTSHVKDTQGAKRSQTASPPQGSSPQSQLLRRTAQQAANAQAPVLITGEPGSGKESLASWLHEQSGQPGPFKVLDRVALSGENAREYLLGADDQPGALAQADGGSLFIPELLDIAPEAQSLLAAVLESGGFIPVNSHARQPLNCRIISAISLDPETAIAENGLDKGLHLQLGVLPLHITPLRERVQDVTDLVSHHTDHLSNTEGLNYRHFSISALNRLRNHDWPGNELELINLVQRLLVLGTDGEVTVQEVEDALRQPGRNASSGSGNARPVTFDLPLREAREAFERDYLIYQLRKAGGSVGKLSDAVGMERTHLYRKLRSLGIDPKKVVRSN